MARETRRSNSERFKYGICLNDECPKCKAKEVQQIAMRKDFVCSECGKELRECPPPKKGGKMPIYIGAGVLVAALTVGVCVFAFGDNEEKKPAEASVDSTAVVEKVDTVPATKEAEVVKEEVVEPVAEEEPVTKSEPSVPVVNKPATLSSSSSGTLRLSYGSYIGATKNGYPHGQGKLTYSTSRQINRNDMKGRTANAGDYVIGEFYNGFVVYGKHYDASGNLLESLTFGVGSEDSYDSK